MNLVINISTLVLGFIIGLFVNSQFILPLIHGLPKSLWYFFKGEIKFMAIISQLITPAIWIVGFFILGIVLELINPALDDFILNGSAFGVGWTLSFFAILLNFLSVSGRASMKEDYDQTTFQKYRK